MKKHTFHIFGGKQELTSKIIDIWKRVAGWECKYIQTNARTAELVKYAENCYLGTKVSFFNVFFDICDKLGIDYNEFVELLTLDERIGKSMTMVNPNNRGFGGKCIPKDMAALIMFLELNGLDNSFLTRIYEQNEHLRSG